MSNNLNNAKRAKNDEFYTLLSDIEYELLEYHSSLMGKIVYCNCDDYERSNFIKYFSQNFNKIGLKKLVCTSYNENGNGVLFVKDRNGVQKSILKGDGSFSSEECKRLMEACDVVITNPPFSKFIDFFNILLEKNKKFLVIGNINAAVSKTIFESIKEGNVWFGSHYVNKFEQPDGSIKKFGNIVWYTNIKTSKQKNWIDLKKSYDESVYPKYFNSDCIEVSKSVNIPKDFSGLMGVPISFLFKLNRDQFDIIDCKEPAIELNYYKKFSCFKKEYLSRQTRINGILCQKLYHRIIIRNKSLSEKEQLPDQEIF